MKIEVYLVEYLLKPGTVEPEKQPLLGNGSEIRPLLGNGSVAVT
jgi:hypothetical protein